MGDVFKEQLLKRLPTATDRLIKAALIAAGFFIIAAVYLFLPGFALVSVFVVGFGLFYGFGAMNREFEYVLTNGELDIDCIYAKARRKRVFSCVLKESILMTHAGNSGDNHELALADRQMDCGRGGVNNGTYYLLAVYGGKRVKVLIEPNDEMLASMRPYLAKRLHGKQI